MAGTQFSRAVGGAASATAGTTQTQAGATALTGSTNLVTTGNAGDGVVLPTGYDDGDVVYVANLSAVTLKVYPATGGALNGGSANASITMKANSTGAFVNLSGGNSWGALFDV